MFKFENPLRKKPVERYPLFEGREAITRHAALTRTVPDKWLTRMETHIRNGDLTLEELEYFVSNYSKEIARVPEKATSMFTYLRQHALATIIDYNRETGGTFVWPTHFPLDGIETYPNNDRVPFHGVDLSKAQIAFCTTLDGNVVDLENGNVKGSPVRWEVEDSYVDVCAEAEKRFRAVFEGSANFDYVPYHGVVLMDQGKAIALFKLYYAKSMLALRTVRDESGDIQFHKGMLYATSAGATEIIKERVMRERIEGAAAQRGLGDSRFLSVDIQDLEARAKHMGMPLGKNALRLLGPRALGENQSKKPDLYEAMNTFAHEIEVGIIPTTPLL